MAYTPVPSKLDDAAFGIATDQVSPAGYLVDEVASDSADEGDIGLARMSAKRIQLAELRDQSGDSAMDDANNAVRATIVSGGFGGAVTVADGADVTQGATTDAPVTSDTTGTVSGKLRGLVKILASVWDSVNGRLKVDASAVAVPVTDNGGNLSVDDGGGSLTVDGTVAVSGNVTVVQSTGTNLKVDASSVAVPVTDNGGLLSVDDGGGSITVDGPLTDTQLRATPVPVSGTVTITDGSGPVTVDGAVTVSGTATVSGTVAVSSITTSIVPGTAATNLGKAEDDAHTSGDTGVMPLTVRNDSANSSYLAGTDGDYQAFQSDSDGNLRGVLSDKTGSGAFVGVATTNILVPAGMTTAIVEVTGTWVGTIGFQGEGPGLGFVSLPVRRMSTGSLVTTTTTNGIFQAPVAGLTALTLTANPWTSGLANVYVRAGQGANVTHVLSHVPGTAADQLGKAEDAGHNSGDTGVMALGVRNDTRGSLAGTDLDYAPPQLNSSGDLRVEPFSLGAAASLGKAEDAGHTSGDTGVMALAVRSDTRGSLAGTDLDYAPPQLNASGDLRVEPFSLGAAASLGKAEDAAHTSGDVGALGLTVRNDSSGATGLAGTDLDYQALQSDSTGSLKVVVTGGATKTDKTGFTEGSGSMTPVGGVFNDTISADPTEDQAAALRITAKRGLHANLRDSAGVEAVVPGTGATHLGKAEDAAHTTGDVGVLALTVRNDASASTGIAGTDLDYQAQQSDTQGRLRVIEAIPVVVSGTLTRPANTTLYTINDELTDTGGAVLAISGCARYNGGAGTIESITVINSVNAATDPSLDIFIFDTTSTPAADNAAFVPSDAVMATCLFSKSLGTALNGDTATSGNLLWHFSGPNLGSIPFVCGGSSTSLFVRFAVRNGYQSPSNSDTFVVRLGIKQF